MKLGVNLRSAFHLIAHLFQWIGLTFLIPLIVAALEQEPLWPWIVSFIAVSALGLGLRLLTKKSDEISLREAFFVTGLSWLFVALVGTLPYLLFSSLGFVDAFFESMSGFTTTGSTVILDIPGQAKSLLLWRSFSQWLGGMGIIVLAVAILPQLAVAGRQLLVAERSATERLTPRISETARTLWVLYAGLTAAEVIALLFAGLSPYDATLHAMTTMPSGGFSPRALGVAEFMPSAQWIIIFFMFLSGVNFTVMYQSLSRGPGQLARDSEFKLYTVITLAASALLLLSIWDLYPAIEEKIRHSLFQTVSIMTTTGFSSVDFNSWSPFAHVLLLVLMLTGGSAGSTAGAIKVIRLLLWGKLLVREIRQILHPKAVIPIRLGARVVNEQALRGIAVFTLLYFGFFIIGSLFLLLDAHLAGGVAGKPLSALEAMMAAATTLGNAGPGVGIFGPMASFADLSDQSKIMLSILMWIGRLEIMPVLVLLTINYWKR